MGTPDDKAARQARAAQLRARIDGIAGAPTAPGPQDPAKQTPVPEATPANPRDFIAKRMRELAPKKK